MNYTVDLRRDETGWWLARVREIDGCHTQGRSIRQVRARIRDAISAATDGTDVADADLNVRPRLASTARRAVDCYARASASLAKEQTAAQRASDEAVRELVIVQRMSVRDAAELLGISHQRVHQVLHAH